MALSDILYGAAQKPVFRQSPDAFILLNQFSYINNAQTGVSIQFNDDIKQVSVQGSIDAPPAKASVSFAVTRADYNKYFAFGRPIFYPMMEIQIYIKGRYNLVLEDNVTQTPPPAYLQFHGVITSVSDEYQGGEHSITIQCEDLLYFLKIIKMAAHPSILYSNTTGSGQTPFTSLFAQTNVKNIIRKICNFAFGGSIGTPGSDSSREANAVFAPDQIGTQAYISAGVSTPFTASNKADFIDSQKRVLSDYWAQRFSIVSGDGTLNQDDSNFLQLLIFAFTSPITTNDSTDPTNTQQGANTKDITFSESQIDLVSGKIVQTTSKGQDAQVADIPGTVSSSTGNTGVIDTSTASQIDYLINNSAPFGQIAQFDVLNTEYSTLMDIAIVCRDYVGYEFYMSLDGNIIFKPPFFNMDVSQYEPFVIKDSDVLNWSIVETDDVITTFTVRGAWSQKVKFPTQFPPAGTASDFRLAKQFLQRQQSTDLNMAANISNPIAQANFLSIYAQNLMDIHNAKRFNGTITIPGTPEIKLGYPVYIASRDCFAYVTNISHNFSFGNTFTTTLQVTALRYKNISGPNVVSEQSETPSPALNGAFNDPELQSREQLGNISGSAAGSSFIRSETPNGKIDTTASFYLNRSQRISDADGYEIIGTIGYAIDTMLDVDGNLVVKPSSPAADSSLGNTTQATQFSNLDVSNSPNTTINAGTPTTTTPVNPTAGQINSIDLNNNKTGNLPA